MKTYYNLLISKKDYNSFGNEVEIMLESFILILLVSPIIASLVLASVRSKDYFDYDSKKLKYVSRVTK